MIDKRAKFKADTAIRIARDISDGVPLKQKKLSIPVMDSDEFWAGINLLLCGEWRQVPSNDPTVVELRRE